MLPLALTSISSIVFGSSKVVQQPPPAPVPSLIPPYLQDQLFECRRDDSDSNPDRNQLKFSNELSKAFYATPSEHRKQAEEYYRRVAELEELDKQLTGHGEVDEIVKHERKRKLFELREHWRCFAALGATFYAFYYFVRQHGFEVAAIDTALTWHQIDPISAGQLVQELKEMRNKDQELEGEDLCDGFQSDSRLAEEGRRSAPSPHALPNPPTTLSPKANNDLSSTSSSCVEDSRVSAHNGAHSGDFLERPHAVSSRMSRIALPGSTSSPPSSHPANPDPCGDDRPVPAAPSVPALAPLSDSLAPLLVVSEMGSAPVRRTAWRVEADQRLG